MTYRSSSHDAPEGLMILMSSPQTSVVKTSCRCSISLPYHPRFRAWKGCNFSSLFCLLMLAGYSLGSSSHFYLQKPQVPVCVLLQHQEQAYWPRQPLSGALQRLPLAQRRLHSSHGTSRASLLHPAEEPPSIGLQACTEHVMHHLHKRSSACNASSADPAGLNIWHRLQLALVGACAPEDIRQHHARGPQSAQ